MTQSMLQPPQIPNEILLKIFSSYPPYLPHDLPEKIMVKYPKLIDFAQALQKHQKHSFPKTTLNEFQFNPMDRKKIPSSWDHHDVYAHFLYHLEHGDSGAQGKHFMIHSKAIEMLNQFLINQHITENISSHLTQKIQWIDTANKPRLENCQNLTDLLYMDKKYRELSIEKPYRAEDFHQKLVNILKQRGPYTFPENFAQNINANLWNISTPKNCLNTIQRSILANHPNFGHPPESEQYITTINSSITKYRLNEYI
jgi:hypothetical protein